MQNTNDKTINRLQDLKDGDAGLFITHHRNVVDYHKKSKSEFVANMRVIAGDPFTEEQKAKLAETNTVPIKIDRIRPIYRTLKGILEKNAYDTTFNPREKKDQKISDLLKNFYTYVSDRAKFQETDINAYMNAWAGMGFTETIIEFYEGEEPKINRYEINPLTVYMDPDSRIPISRTDCNFIDRVHWIDKNTLEQKFPWIDFEKLSNSVNSYSIKTQPHIDRDHENMDIKNDTYKVIERLYRVKKNIYWMMDENMDKVVVEEKLAKEYMKAGKRINSKPDEYLYVALVCPAWSNTDFIYNGPYFCNPKRQGGNEIIFPIQEIVAETINGKVLNYVTPLIDPQLCLNAAVTQAYDAMKQEVGTNVITKEENWSSPEEMQRFGRERTMNGKTFIAADGIQNLNTVATLAPKNPPLSSNNQNLISIASNAIDQTSSVPPSLQGLTETSVTSGVLNEQRTAQATTQNQGFFSNVLKYQRNCAELVLSYLYEFRDQFKSTTFRIVENPAMKSIAQPTENQEFSMLTPTPNIDEMGNWDGTIQLLDDPTVYTYDIVVEPSSFSATERENSARALTEIARMGLLSGNPQLANELTLSIIDLLNIPQDIKDRMTNATQVATQAQSNTQQLQDHGQMIENMKNLGAPGGNAPPVPGG